MIIIRILTRLRKLYMTKDTHTHTHTSNASCRHRISKWWWCLTALILCQTFCLFHFLAFIMMHCCALHTLCLIDATVIISFSPNHFEFKSYRFQTARLLRILRLLSLFGQMDEWRMTKIAGKWWISFEIVSNFIELKIISKDLKLQSIERRI